MADDKNFFAKNWKGILAAAVGILTIGGGVLYDEKSGNADRRRERIKKEEEQLRIRHAERRREYELFMRDVDKKYRGSDIPEGDLIDYILRCHYLGYDAKEKLIQIIRSGYNKGDRLNRSILSIVYDPDCSQYETMKIVNHIKNDHEPTSTEIVLDSLNKLSDSIIKTFGNNNSSKKEEQNEKRN